MYSDSESDDAAYDGILDSDDEPVNKSDSDFDFIVQGDEDDGEIDFDAELSLFADIPLGSQSMEIMRENYENALELATENVQLKTELELTKAENSRLTQEREEKKIGSNRQIIKFKQEVKELKKKMEQQKVTNGNRSLRSDRFLLPPKT